MKKAATEIIGFVTVTLIAVVIIGSTFFWAMNLIEKNRQYSTVQYSEDVSVKISKAIEKVIQERTQQNVAIELAHGQIIYITNSTIILENSNVFIDENLGGINYLRGSLEICNATNVTIGTENACVVSKYLNKFEIYFIDLFSESEEKIYKIYFEIDEVGAATKGSHNLIISHNGIEESGNTVTQKIKFNLQ